MPSSTNNRGEIAWQTFSILNIFFNNFLWEIHFRNRHFRGSILSHDMHKKSTSVSCEGVLFLKSRKVEGYVSQYSPQFLYLPFLDYYWKTPPNFEKTSRGCFTSIPLKTLNCKERDSLKKTTFNPRLNGEPEQLIIHRPTT